MRRNTARFANGDCLPSLAPSLGCPSYLSTLFPPLGSDPPATRHTLTRHYSSAAVSYGNWAKRAHGSSSIRCRMYMRIPDSHQIVAIRGRGTTSGWEAEGLSKMADVSCRDCRLRRAPSPLRSDSIQIRSEIASRDTPEPDSAQALPRHTTHSWSQPPHRSAPRLSSICCARARGRFARVRTPTHAGGVRRTTRYFQRPSHEKGAEGVGNRPKRKRKEKTVDQGGWQAGLASRGGGPKNPMSPRGYRREEERAPFLPGSGQLSKAQFGFVRCGNPIASTQRVPWYDTIRRVLP